jgi:hypothetical protein
MFFYHWLRSRCTQIKHKGVKMLWTKKGSIVFLNAWTLMVTEPYIARKSTPDKYKTDSVSPISLRKSWRSNPLNTQNVYIWLSRNICKDTTKDRFCYYNSQSKLCIDHNYCDWSVHFHNPQEYGLKERL